MEKKCRITPLETMHLKEDAVEVSEENYEPMDYPIRLKNYNAISQNPLEINKNRYRDMDKPAGRP